MQEINFWAKLKIWQKLFFFLAGVILGIFFLTTSGFKILEKGYGGRIYPGVRIEGKDFGGQSSQTVENYFRQKNSQVELNFTFIYQGEIATLSAGELNWGYDEKLIATQALSFGRSGYLFSDLYQKLLSLRIGYDLKVSYSYNESKLADILGKFAAKIDFPPQEALFRFAGGRVTAFQPSANGQSLDQEGVKKMIRASFILLAKGTLPPSLTIELPIKTLEAKVKTEEANNLGIKELVGRGTSKFLGSDRNRTHNIQLAASRLNGVLVAPEEEFSFNIALGDVSKFTGYKEAYIIKEGRTILGDGGGVCQVSTTFFRAILNAGLPILERHPHSYRVSYYEQGSGPGFDASVYAPGWDLKFKNDTGHYLLVQSSVDLKSATLTFDLYGTKDGRKVTITKPVITNRIPPPEDLYQDDPGLPKGQIKQIERRIEGADVFFTRKVERAVEVLTQETFNSHYQPWRAIYLRGTKE